MKIKFNNEIFLGMLMNDEEKRKALRSSINTENYSDQLMRNIATALKQEEFSFVDLLTKYGRETCVIAMGLSNDAAKIDLAEKHKKKRGNMDEILTPEDRNHEDIIDGNVHWIKKYERNQNFDLGLDYLSNFIEDFNNVWNLYTALRLMLGEGKAQDIADLLEI